MKKTNAVMYVTIHDMINALDDLSLSIHCPTEETTCYICENRTICHKFSVAIGTLWELADAFVEKTLIEIGIERGKQNEK